MTVTAIHLLLLLLLLLLVGNSWAARTLRFVSPLHSLTLRENNNSNNNNQDEDEWDTFAPPRRRFLQRLRGENNEWKKADASTVQKSSSSSSSSCPYQFVGVVQPQQQQQQQQEQQEGGLSIAWYARPRPVDADWLVRLVHVDRAAVLKDLYNRKKIDLYGSYHKRQRESAEEAVTSNNEPTVIQGTYEARKRSWRNMWNFSPVAFFTDSSGQFWRERRLREGYYTDGAAVFKASYRYRDGRNGMHRLSTLDQFMASPATDPVVKERIRRKLAEDAAPDVVLED